MSEFIDKNKEYPDPKEEWKQAKLLITTIKESGALRLLERLFESITQNPLLAQSNIKLSKHIYVKDVQGVRNLAGVDKDQSGYEVRPVPMEYVHGSERYNSYLHPPHAVVLLRYNPRRVYPELRAGFPPQSSYNEFDALIVECEGPGQLCFWRTDWIEEFFQYPREYISGSSVKRERKGLLKMQESEWRSRLAIIDQALGKLYSEQPAKSR